ncbi:hypothetical protein B0H16DRAFT_1468367 [Mycena metata]|uniref:Uncharacterized protein n=1 Tax=Mycena metata TaxID=1033252 RepID=A0AAD7I1F7_9AGAR|nr:hypothetical protein B0H16DRAFT_1468367 [Mycena metata]
MRLGVRPHKEGYSWADRWAGAPEDAAQPPRSSGVSYHDRIRVEHIKRRGGEQGATSKNRGRKGRELEKMEEWGRKKEEGDARVRLGTVVGKVAELGAWWAGRRAARARAWVGAWQKDARRERGWTGSRARDGRRYEGMETAGARADAGVDRREVGGQGTL